MHNLCVFDYFVSKIIFTENYFLIAAIILTTQISLYACLVGTKLVLGPQEQHFTKTFEAFSHT